ncbi:MAG: thiamine diphosphokinase [Negativicutes bacterium]|nr:thiamine diphosphokinase [Negativicutes bacterium]
MKRALIFLAGEFAGLPAGFFRQANDFVIAADGGYGHLLNLHWQPDLLIGDFDSFLPEWQNEVKQKAIECLVWPTEKDMTDSELALQLASQRGCGSAIVFGGWGGLRMDHAVANLFLLAAFRQKDFPIIFSHGAQQACVISNETLQLYGEKGDYISLLPCTAVVSDVTTCGMKYPLSRHSLKAGSSFGVSNQFSGATASVRCGEGMLLVIWFGKLQ